MSDTNELMDEAWELLASLEPERALGIANQLIRMGDAGGYEVAALAHLQTEDNEEAIRTLEKGVKAAPDLWVLWQLLGNCYSEDDRNDEALESFQRALECPEVDPNSVHLNIAIVLARNEQYERSNVELMLVSGSETEPRKHAIRMSNYASQKRWDDILNQAPAVLEELESNIDEYDPMSMLTSDLSRIYSRWAEAMLECDEPDPGRAHATACRAVLLDQENDFALRIVRLCDDQYRTRDDSMYRIIVEGHWDDEMEDDEVQVRGFKSTYWVLASSPTEALEFAKRIEPDGTGATMQLRDFDTEPAEPADEYKGVYDRSGYEFFDLDHIVEL